jgi:hypothetical protein
MKTQARNSNQYRNHSHTNTHNILNLYDLERSSSDVIKNVSQDPFQSCVEWRAELGGCYVFGLPGTFPLMLVSGPGPRIGWDELTGVARLSSVSSCLCQSWAAVHITSCPFCLAGSVCCLVHLWPLKLEDTVSIQSRAGTLFMLNGDWVCYTAVFKEHFIMSQLFAWTYRNMCPAFSLFCL